MAFPHRVQIALLTPYTWLQKASAIIYIYREVHFKIDAVPVGFKSIWVAEEVFPKSEYQGTFYPETQ